METEIISGSMQLSTSMLSPYSAQQIPAYWRAVEFLSSNLASFPITVQADGTKKAEAHPLDKLFTRKANPDQTSKTVFKTWAYHGEHEGNGYLFIRRDPVTADPIAFYNLLPIDVTPFRLVPQDGSLFDATTWYWHGPSHRAFPAADVAHYKPQISYDGLSGYNPSMMFAPTFARAQMLEVYQTKFLRKGTMVRGSIELPQGTTKEQASEIIDTMKRYRSATGDNDVIVLSGGAKLTNTTISPVDAQLLEQDQALIKKIAQITGVPQQFLYDTTDTKYNAATVEAYGQDVVRFTFRPRLELLEAELSTKLLSEAEQDAGLSIHFDTSALVRGDTAVEMTIAAAGVAAGLQTRNEGREDIGLAPVEDPAADKLLVPSAVATESSSQEESETHAAAPAPDHYAAMQPILDDATARIERKSAKALETAQKKPEAERVIYTNVLADQQRTYAAEALTPIAEAIETLTGKKMDVQAIAESYAGEIRRRAAGQDPRTLAQIVKEQNGKI